MRSTLLLLCCLTVDAVYPTITQTPTGYYPYSFTYKASWLSSITDNSVQFPTMGITDYTPDSTTSVPLYWSFDVLINIFVPCAAPPAGRRLKAWASFQPRKTKTCNSYSECAIYREPCVLSDSTECTGWDASLGQGWYASNVGQCTACPNSSQYSTCSWGEYRRLDDCTPDRVPSCVQCNGTLPGNATWTTSKYPHYFLASDPSPCNWDCNMGFFKMNDVCVACTKPENSIFDVGPYIGFGISNPPPKTCLNPADVSTCKYFGGVSGYGCAWKCPSGFMVKQLQSAYGGVKCEACAAKTCLPGQSLFFNGECNDCQTCSPIVSNAIYSADCAFTCAAGYYKYNATYCKACSVQACASSQYSGGCGGFVDSSCQPCSTCLIGTKASSECSPTANTNCTACTTSLPANGGFDANCNITCNANFVMVGSTCVSCAVSNSNCRIGKYRVAACTAQNLGCDDCIVPATSNWCWTGISQCSWECIQSYRKLNDKCIFDTTKTTVISCASAVFLEQVTGGLLTTGSVITNAITTAVPGVVTTRAAASAVTTIRTTLVVGSTTPVFVTTNEHTTTSYMATTPAPPAVTRETLSISNITLPQCLCSSVQVAAELSTLYKTPVYVVACETADTQTICENFKCPCSAARRLLQADTTNYQLVYQTATVQNLTSQQLTPYIQKVLPMAVVQERAVSVIAGTSIAWDTVFFTTKQAATETSTDYTVLVVVIAVAVVGAGIGIYFYERNMPPVLPQRIISIKIPSSGSG